MKFTVNSKTLYNTLQKIGKVINSKNALPILDTFKLHIKGNIINVTASDQEINLSSKIDLSTSDVDSLSFCINAKNILDAIKEIPEQDILFDVKSDTKDLTVKYNNGKYKLPIQSDEFYPIPRKLDDKNIQKLHISMDSLLQGISSVGFAMGNDELRPVMNGVFFDIREDSVTFVASDGMKLIRYIDYNSKGDSISSFILPKKAVNLINSINPRNSKNLIVKFDLTNIFIAFDDIEFFIRMVEGKYPNYNSIIPNNETTTLIVERLLLLSIIKRVSVFSDKVNGLIKLTMSDGLLNISSQDLDFSVSAEEITTEVEKTGSDIEIGFKSQFIVDILNNIHDDEVSIRLFSPNKASVITPLSNTSGTESLSLLMPIAI